MRSSCSGGTSTNWIYKIREQMSNVQEVKT